MSRPPTKESINAMREQIMADLATLRNSVALGAEVEDALSSVETFVNIALGVFSQTNPSKLREHMRVVELRSLIPSDAPC